MIGSRRFQLMVRADVVPERVLQVSRLEDLVSDLRDAEQRISDQPPSEEERAIRAEFGTAVAPVLLGRNGGLLLPTGEVAVKFRPDIVKSEIEVKVRESGGTIIRSLSFLPNSYLLRPRNGGDGIELANSLVEGGDVEFASPNFIEEMPWRAHNPPPNELFSRQWHLDNVGQGGAQPQADVRALEAWGITTGTPEIVVCIIDSGVDRAHPAFAGPGKVVPGYDFQDDDALADPTTSSHGTSCAGVAVAPWGVGRVVGIAPDCRLMPIRRSSLSEHLKMAEAFAWAADNGADIISCSFGYDNRPWILPDVVRATMDQAVIQGRGGRGCVLVWAAGNGNELISSDEWASNDNVLAVGASTDADVRASYSDFGPELDLCAPSSGGRNGITTTSNGGYTDQFGGTSSAAPLVAGIAALLLSVNPNLTWREIQDLLCYSADRVDPENGSYDNNGHSNLYGYGRVNAYEALNAISVLDEAVRNSDLPSQLPRIQQFSAQFLEPRPAGQTIIQFLRGQRFRILSLLNSEPEFRRRVVIVLRATAAAFEALQQGEDVVLSDTFWDAIAVIISKLLPADREASDADNLTSTKKEFAMSEAEKSTSGSYEDRSTAMERSPFSPTASRELQASKLDDALQRIGQILKKSSSAERDAPATPQPSVPSNVRLEDFIEATSGAVLRALDAREQQAGDERRALTLPPITVGIIFNPRLEA